ncbi:hypothetical protein DPMN_183787 [Dreissena polymorpha]|uniref:Tyr recombinase domain-containing protein n=1 Tax=Dreissena polymorpha TaxID=45954 RepID=A0A9D4I3W9_DREPO|nr:hypothetical protein DPMN_183787 [Dreissena polymorpha]
MTLHPGDSCVNNWMLKAMAKDAGFLKHKRITNHSVRKFLVQKLRNANIPPTETMAITGHKNSCSTSASTSSALDTLVIETFFSATNDTTKWKLGIEVRRNQ